MCETSLFAHHPHACTASDVHAGGCTAHPGWAPAAAIALRFRNRAELSSFGEPSIACGSSPIGDASSRFTLKNSASVPSVRKRAEGQHEVGKFAVSVNNSDVSFRLLVSVLCIIS